MGQKHESSTHTFTADVTVTQAGSVAQGSEPEPAAAAVVVVVPVPALELPPVPEPASALQAWPSCWMSLAVVGSLGWRQVAQLLTSEVPAEMKTLQAHVTSVAPQFARAVAHAH